MEKKVSIVLSVILLIISANMVAVNSDASDCNDACTTACVFTDPRLSARCNRKCDIRCSPGTIDRWRWKATSDGIFSVKTAYQIFSLKGRPVNKRRQEEESALIWKAKAPAKVITTAWKILKGRLPTLDNLRKRQVVVPVDQCVLCQEDEESIEHLLFSCRKADGIWKNILSWIGKQSVLHHKTKDHFNAFVNIGSKNEVIFFLEVWICVTWSIWKSRNNCIFNNGSWNPERIMADIKSSLWSWRVVSDRSFQKQDFRSWFSAARFPG